jgi:hypothetical protein
MHKPWYKHRYESNLWTECQMKKGFDRAIAQPFIAYRVHGALGRPGVWSDNCRNSGSHYRRGERVEVTGAAPLVKTRTTEVAGLSRAGRSLRCP